MSDFDLKVSVIIPVYNIQDYLVETIHSVLNQNLIGFELILVDDGSTDFSQNICASFSRLDRRVIVLRQENSGVSVARNLGLDQAIGEYVYFLDSDDTIDKDFLESSYKIAKEGDLDVVVLGESYEDRLPDPTALPTCAQFWKREFLNQYPEIRFPEGIQPCEDGLFSHQLLALTDRVGFNPNVKYFYREHANQNHKQILKNVEKVLQKIPIWLEILKSFYIKKGLFQKKSLHLAKFIQHEPFEFRYIRFPLNGDQKRYLFQLISTFMKEHVLPNLTEEQKSKLSIPFRKFYESQDYQEFDHWLEISSKLLKRKRKQHLFMTKFIPIAKWRRKARKRVMKKYADWFEM